LHELPKRERYLFQEGFYKKDEKGKEEPVSREVVGWDITKTITCSDFCKRNGTG
jgi:hypothetical protein